MIDWHRRDLLPFTAGLATDPRTRFVRADFFAAVADGTGSTRTSRVAGSTPCCSTWTTRRARCCTPATRTSTRSPGCAGSPRCLHPDGVFALWSNDPPDPAFQRVLTEVFPTSVAHVVRFPNPLQGRESANTVYVARH